MSNEYQIRTKVTTDRWYTTRAESVEEALQNFRSEKDIEFHGDETIDPQEDGTVHELWKPDGTIYSGGLNPIRYCIMCKKGPLYEGYTDGDIEYLCSEACLIAAQWVVNDPRTDEEVTIENNEHLGEMLNANEMNFPVYWTEWPKGDEPDFDDPDE